MTFTVGFSLLILFGAAFICGACRVASAADRQTEQLMRNIEAEAERAACLAEAGCPPSHFDTDSRELQRNPALRSPHSTELRDVY